MPAKVDFGRDYYADLELSPTADVNDIKKQFRKLALKYHPDRNPGRETEVNAQFQTIQSAHEVLTSPEQKSKYDAQRNRRSSRFPAASGVRGNPWQNVSSQFPPPPRRPGTTPQNAAPTTPKRPGATPSQAGASGANRWSGFNVPRPTATSQSGQADPESRYNAWTNMRPRNNGKAAGAMGTAGTAGGAASTQAADKAKTSFFSATAKPATSGPTPTPRATSTSQRQKSQASFGTRKSGFAPRNTYGDEPPVTSSNYSTTRTNPSLFNDTPANARRTRRASSNVSGSNMFRDSFLDSRQPTPYQSQGGEKLDVFDGSNMSRAKSTRENPGTGDGALHPGPAARHRSASAPGEAEETAGLGSTQVPNYQNATSAASKEAPSASHLGDQYQPRKQGTQPQLRHAFVSEDSVPNGAGASMKGGFATPSTEHATHETLNRSGYAYSRINVIPPPPSPHISLNSATPRDMYNACQTELHGAGLDDVDGGTFSPELQAMVDRVHPSGGVWQPKPQASDGAKESPYNDFEKRMFDLLRSVIDETSPSPNVPRMSKAEEDTATSSDTGADKGAPNSFNFAATDAHVPPSTPDQHRVMRNSAESINTRFVDEEHANTNWQFNAGTAAGPDAIRPPRRSQSSSRLGRSPPKARQSPLRNGRARGAVNGVNGMNGGSTAANAAGSTGFDAGEWTQKLGPELFAPQPGQATASPTRPIQRPSKKPRAVQKTAGTAGLVDEESTSSSEDKSRPQTATGSLNEGVDSPNAMDIDPPAEEPPVAVPQNGARSIPGEPSRPDWRAGAVPGVARPAVAPNFGQAFATNNAAGSEDTDGFNTSFADFKKVAPFANTPTGLGSFGDLKNSLPFESKPSARLPITRPARKVSINFPRPPTAPRAPPALSVTGLKPTDASWAKYLTDFDGYMNQWVLVNNQYVDHFAARRSEIEKQRRDGGFTWLSTRSDAGIREYLSWLEQDREVRAKWDTAVAEHEQRVREFMGHRDKMLK